MATFPVIVDLGYIVAGAGSLLLLTRRFGVPPILAYMLAGLLLGPVSGVLEASESVELFSELGIALLLFLVGLELSLPRLRDVGRTALTVGLVQVAVTAVAGAGLSFALGFSTGDALLLGLVTAFSSTVVVVKLLDRSGEIASLHGRMAIGILLVQDVVIAVVLTLVSGVAGDEAMGVGALVRGLASAGLGIVTLGVVAWVGVRWLLPPLMAWFGGIAEGPFLLSLTWCFGFILLAETFHISVELGAFIAGVGLAQISYREELMRRVHPLVDFFLAVFFVSLGARMDLGAIPELWVPTVLLSSFVLLGKPAIVFLILRRSTGARAAFLSGVTLGQVSEFAFILVALAMGAGIVADPRIPALVGLMGLLTIGVSSVLVPRAPRLMKRLLPDLRPEDEDRPVVPHDHGEKDHVVVVGMNTLGRDLVRRFAGLGESVVAIDTDPPKLEGLPARSVSGNADSPSVLEEAGIERAKIVVSTLQIEDVNALLAYRCRRLDVAVVVHAFDPAVTDELLEIGVDHLMVPKLDGIPFMKRELRRIGVPV